MSFKVCLMKIANGDVFYEFYDELWISWYIWKWHEKYMMHMCVKTCTWWLYDMKSWTLNVRPFGLKSHKSLMCKTNWVRVPLASATRPFGLKSHRQLKYKTDWVKVLSASISNKTMKTKGRQAWHDDDVRHDLWHFNDEMYQYVYEFE